MPIRTTIALMVALSAGYAQSEPFAIQPSAESRFELSVYKTGLLAGKKHIFVFDRYRGRFDGIRMEFAIEAASIRCLDDWGPAKGKIEEIVKVALKDVLDAARHPELRFVAASVTVPASGPFVVNGELTIRGIAKPVKVTVKQKGDVLEGQARIKHSDYGLKQQSAALGAIGTKDEMDVTFRLQRSAL